VATEVPEDVDKRAFFARQIAKNLLPSLHLKTHFKAIATISNSLPISSLARDHEHIHAKDESLEDSLDEDGMKPKNKVTSSQNF
jgi:hypothetical protein